MVETFTKSKLEGMAEDFFYKGKKQFFKDFFKLWISSEVKSDMAYRRKSVSRGPNTGL